MKISTRGRYGIRLLLDLSEHENEDCVTLSSISQRLDISVRYLEQVAIILRRASFIRSVKGASGGYALNHPCEEIVIGDVLRSLEGDMLVADICAGGKETAIASCIRRMVYDPLNKKISEVIDRITLASIANGKDDEVAYMYFI
ncbi:MAG: Rrf2 family transcriptional regulator [Termitinemataceae bacterium]|nr:MAG: Rrf2 family transcriptional regulator [Termitinemataceae bacterium]